MEQVKFIHPDDSGERNQQVEETLGVENNNSEDFDTAFADKRFDDAIAIMKEKKEKAETNNQKIKVRNFEAMLISHFLGVDEKDKAREIWEGMEPSEDKNTFAKRFEE